MQSETRLTSFTSGFVNIHGMGTRMVTYVIGKYPVLPFSIPSNQLSSTFCLRWITSPSLNPSSPGFSGSKSYKACAVGWAALVGVVAGECLGEGDGLLQSPNPGADGCGVPEGEADGLVDIRLPLVGRLLELNPLCELKEFEEFGAKNFPPFSCFCG